MTHPPTNIAYAGTGEHERECWMPDPFHCPECRAVLRCENDYATGNHYWTLRCADHGRFTASTYRYGDFDGMIPRPWPETDA